MKYIRQFGIIMVITFIAEALVQVLPFSIPAGFYGLVIMLLLLQFRVIRLDQIEETSNFLLEIISIILIPTAVGLIGYYDFIKSYWLQLLIITTVSCVLVVIVTGKVTESLIRLFHNLRGRNPRI